MNIKDNYHIISEVFFWGGEGKKKEKRELHNFKDLAET